MEPSNVPQSSSPLDDRFLPPGASPQLVRLTRFARRPLERFLRIEAASGIVLLLSAAVALFLANSPFRDSYHALWQLPLGIRVGSFAFERSLEWIVNDGLMVIFFFVVGLEIRREIHHGELSEWRRASLPVIAAIGGMVVPALLYLAVASAPATHAGWGVPMATDIAFAVGILTLLGSRVPPALRVLLLALAVIDDLGAIIVIALFYSSGISPLGLGLASVGFLGILMMQRFGIRSKAAYVVPALVAWIGTYASGIHPTIAGVIVGLLTPVHAWLGPEGFVAGVRTQIDELELEAQATASPHALATSLRRIDTARREALSPVDSVIESLHPWVAFAIMPIFALANAGVSLESAAMDASSGRVIVGVTLGLVIGKPLGIVGACWLALRLRLGVLPLGLSLRHLWVLGAVAGIGLTMALFVAQLAFSRPDLLTMAKLGVLAASCIAGVTSIVLGRILLTTQRVPGAAQTADEAEASTET